MLELMPFERSAFFEADLSLTAWDSSDEMTLSVVV